MLSGLGPDQSRGLRIANCEAVATTMLSGLGPDLPSSSNRHSQNSINNNWGLGRTRTAFTGRSP